MKRTKAVPGKKSVRANIKTSINSERETRKPWDNSKRSPEAVRNYTKVGHSPIKPEAVRNYTKVSHSPVKNYNSRHSRSTPALLPEANIGASSIAGVTSPNARFEPPLIMEDSDEGLDHYYNNMSAKQ